MQCTKVPNTIDSHREDFAEPSVLDRAISLESLSWMTLGWVVVASLRSCCASPTISAWPLSASEGRLASDALSIVQGGSISASASASPLPTALTALALFLFGASDGIVRVVPLLAGLGTIGIRLHGCGRSQAGGDLADGADRRNLADAGDGVPVGDRGALLVFSSLLAFVVGLRWMRVPVDRAWRFCSGLRPR